MGSHAKVIPGIDVAAADRFSVLKGAKVGVLANQASVDTNGCHLLTLLKEQSQCKLTKFFAPEHGFSGAAQDMVAVSNEVDSATGIEIISLYGDSVASLSPSVSDFAEIDILVVDLIDVGARYYTFAQSMAYSMKVAGEAGVKVVVLDRPNPLGGIQIEGSPLTKECRSYCGVGLIANRHGLTLGELAILFQDGFGNGENAIEKHVCDLEVVLAKGWQRSMYLDETDISWIAPSPNMVTMNTAIVYPGSCLFEATNISEGRGTDSPFETLGAPFIEPEKWIAATNKLGVPLEGVKFHPIEFTPKFQKHAGKSCHGLRIEVTDRLVFQPYRCGIALLIAAANAFPDHFKWREKPYEFIAHIPAIDLLYGDSTLRQAIEGTASIETVLNQLEKFENWFGSARAAYLCY